MTQNVRDSRLSTHSTRTVESERFPAFAPARASVRPISNELEALKAYSSSHAGSTYEQHGLGVPKLPVQLREIERQEQKEGDRFRETERSKDKNKKQLKIIIVFLTVLAMAAIGVGFFFYLNQVDEDDVYYDYEAPEFVLIVPLDKVQLQVACRRTEVPFFGCQSENKGFSCGGRSFGESSCAGLLRCSCPEGQLFEPVEDSCFNIITGDPPTCIPLDLRLLD